MKELKIIDVKIEKILFENNIVVPDSSGTVDIQIGSKLSSIVSYDEKNDRCKCTTNVEITPQNIQVDFKVLIRVTGIFNYDKNDNRNEIHVAACKKLFPHVQSRVTSLMALVGIPNYFLEEPEIRIEDVKVGIDKESE